MNVWICEIELYICYVNNDKQTHNDMKNNRQWNPGRFQIKYNTKCGHPMTIQVRGREMDDILYKLGDRPMQITKL